MEGRYAAGSPCNSGKRKLKGAVTLKIDGREAELAPFVQNLIRNVTLAVVQELDGYEAGARIDVTIE
jgi:hypothetical protein